MRNSLEAFESMGFTVETDLSNMDKKEVDDNLSENTAEKKETTIKITKGTRDACVRARLIPEVYKDTEFDVEKVKKNYAEQNAGSKKFEMINFDGYIEITCGIISSLRSGKNLRQSYIIGAPNGMGKTSFAHTAIMTMYERRMNVVPYVSLTELAEIKVENERRLANGIGMGASERFKKFNVEYQNDRGDISRSRDNELSYRGEDLSYYQDINEAEYYKKPTVITGQYSWSEYMNADVLFCYLSGITTREIESHILRTILEIRGAKGLPTVVMISTSLNLYKNHSTLGPYIWHEILTYDDNKETSGNGSLDRLKHISCFRLNRSV